MYLREREILVIDCEVKEVKEERSINVTFLDLEDGKTYVIVEKNIDLLAALNNKLSKLRVTLELIESKGNLKLAFTDQIENLGRV